MYNAMYTFVTNFYFDYLGSFGLPRRSGKLKDLTKFDASMFGVHAKQANRMDPQLRLLLEVTYEAIVDAGVVLFSINFQHTNTST